MPSRSWLHLADDAIKDHYFVPIPRRFLHLPTVRIVFGPWVLVGRIRKVKSRETGDALQVRAAVGRSQDGAKIR